MNATHSPSCSLLFLDCGSLQDPGRQAWMRITRVLSNCDARNDDDQHFQFGMFGDAFTNDVTSSPFFDKYFYCLWWGLRNLRLGLILNQIKPYIFAISVYTDVSFVLVCVVLMDRVLQRVH